MRRCVYSSVPLSTTVHRGVPRSTLIPKKHTSERSERASVYCGTPVPKTPREKRFTTPVDRSFIQIVDQMRPYARIPDKDVVEAALRLGAEFAVAAPDEWRAIVTENRPARDSLAEFVRVARAPATAKRYQVGGR